MLFTVKTNDGTYGVTAFFKRHGELESTLIMVSPGLPESTLELKGDEESIDVAYEVIETIPQGYEIQMKDIFENVQKGLALRKHKNLEDMRRRCQRGEEFFTEHQVRGTEKCRQREASQSSEREVFLRAESLEDLLNIFRSL